VSISDINFGYLETLGGEFFQKVSRLLINSSAGKRQKVGREQENKVLDN
jgi:hypothetical protein